jgi:hypothetical protein
VFVFATEDIGKDSEILISYADNAPNKALLMKYGFVDRGSTGYDILELPKSTVASGAISSHRMMRCVEK